MLPIKHFSLRVSILALFVTTFVTLVLAVIIIGTINFSKAISFYSEKLMSDAAKSVLRELILQITPADRLSWLTKSLIENDFIDPDQMVDYNLYIAKNLPIEPSSHPLRRTAWGDNKGNTIVTYLEPDNTYSSAIINRTSTPPVHEWLYRDLKDTVIKHVNMTKNLNYDPRIRPWYHFAEDAGKPVWTPAFLSYRYKDLTTNAVTPIYSKKGELLGVFEIDVLLGGISKFLSTLKVGENSVAFIINDENNLIAFPGMEDLLQKEAEEAKFVTLESTGKPWLAPSLIEYDKTHSNLFRYNYNGETYLASFQTIPEFAAYGWKIGVVVPESSFIGSLKKTNTLITLISLGILLLGVLLASIFSKRISQPMRALVNETEKIKNFHLEGDTTIKSIIKEVDHLANAIQSMKINLRSFQKYVPASLVRQLIQTGKDIQLGGAKKTLTFFFSDIKGFTTISEAMDPEQLMLYLCEYIDELSKIISEEHGTIDKFIGDSIMAFWGAPLADEKQCQHACSAALKCQKRISELNNTWKSQGKAPLFTRIGIHTGVAIVGNMGSSERLNYTALGDSVNTPSRLEGINTNLWNKDNYQ